MLRDFSVFGCGIRSQVRPGDRPGTYRITRWITLAAVPVLPLSRWRAVYAGEDFPEPFLDPCVRFREVDRLPLEPMPVQRTYLKGFAITIAAVSPAAALIVRTEGRAATAWEFVAVILATFWPASIMLFALIRPAHRLRREAARAVRLAPRVAVAGLSRDTSTDAEVDRCEGW